jgi:hypothetical protein
MPERLTNVLHGIMLNGGSLITEVLLELIWCKQRLPAQTVLS